MDTVIEIKNITKIYNLYNKPSDRLKEALFSRKSRHTEFAALNDVSFDVCKGEILGIIGKNGSGKSTILKIITNVLTPTSGECIVKGKIAGGAISWFDLKYFKVQPSEFAKSILVIFMAIYYNKLHYKKVKNIYAYFVPLGFAAIIIGLVFMQPDLGSAAIIAGIVFLTFISIPVVQNNIMKFIKIIAIGCILAMVAFLYSGNDFLSSIQKGRLNFRNPCSRYTETTGYQVCNGFIAINNGGLFGVGLGNSTQKYLYLPESHTDFIFPIIVEELGLVTGIIIILGYVYVLSRILKIAKTSENLRCSILAYGTFWYFTLHILVNLLGVLALIPLTGVPLPFLSYGGSFTVNAIIMIFVVERVNIENKINKTKREIKAL